MRAVSFVQGPLPLSIKNYNRQSIVLHDKVHVACGESDEDRSFVPALTVQQSPSIQHIGHILW